MPTISTDRKVQTVITTFEVNPGTCQDLLGELQSTCDQVISQQKGFISAALHANDAQTRIANYSQWETREDFQAMLRSETMLVRSRKINGMCKNFEPVMYDVVYCSE